MVTRFMEVMFSNTDEELAKQVDNDIKNAQQNGVVDTEEVRYERANDNGDVAITDKENGEVTIAQKATDEADTYDLIAVPDEQLEKFLHPSDDGVHEGNQVGAPDEHVEDHFDGESVISPNLPNGGLNPEAGHEKTVVERDEDHEDEEDETEVIEEQEQTDEDDVEAKTEEEPSKPNNNNLKATTPFQRTIQEYLENYSNTDEAFKERYSNPEKNIVDCCNYIMNQVQKSGCNGFADEEIYKMARDYYVDEISKDDVKAISGTVVVNHTVELTEEEKLKARVEAMKKLEQEILDEERKKREEEAKAQAKAEEKARKKEEERIRKEEEKKKAEAERKAKELEEAKQSGGGEQMSIFDF